MTSYLLRPDGRKKMPMIFGQAGEYINRPLEGPAGIDYGIEVRQKRKKVALSFGFSQWIGPRGTGEAAQQQDYFYTDGEGVMMYLNIPESFALVFSARVGYFRLAIFYVGETTHCVTAIKITNGDPARNESIGGGRCGLAYNVQPEKNSQDSTTGKEHQTVTQKVEPSYGKIIATSGLRNETFDHTLFQSDGGCYVWIHNGQIKRSETCLSDQVLADLDIEESLRALEDKRNREKPYKAQYGL